ncbi:MAG: DUF362 domain-containing protein [Methanobacterium sp.]|jgi:uncharacterized protein (DUF362 family)/NAD-dependent dihydropyrimidine dehydrogenase PreA subunit|uniref:DUF362 domain-containing protein n=1 Tax=Methanobacterium sp. TaxID=2164 RepID=UPI002805202E|nr:DUF362 domain-containing protein [uncultured Methanobacterium sp.]
MGKTQVAVDECHSYSVPEVQKAIKTCLDSLGGLKQFIQPGDRVLLKPNLLQAQPPEEYITTHPALVEAVINLVKNAGGIPQVGDSPGGFDRNIEQYWRVTGLMEVCQRLDVELVSFESSGSYSKQRNGHTYHIARPVLDADLLINLPKIKTHGLTTLTCAIKNLYGTIPGFTKVEYHKQAPQPLQFAEKVVDIYALNQPCLHIVDGVVGMEGVGPSAGKPRELGMILVAEDGVALDSVITRALGRDSLKIPTTRIAYQQGLGEADTNKIEIRGSIPHIDNFKWPPKLSSTLDAIPAPVARGIMKFWWTRPVIDPKKCNQCRKCQESCPTEALKRPTTVEKDVRTYQPEFYYDDCINCLCCMEMCPQKAIYHKQSLLHRLTSLFSKS